MFGYRYKYQQPSNISSSALSKTPRCTNKYDLGQITSSINWGSTLSSSITESDLLKYADLNIDLKELNVLLDEFKRKKTQKNSNLRKLNSSSSRWFGKKKTNNIIKKSQRNSIEKSFKEEEIKFNKNFKKILSEKIKKKH